MRKLAFLMAVPYVVSVSTGGFWNKESLLYEIKGTAMRCETMNVNDGSCEFMKDWAESMNMAHAKREEDRKAKNLTDAIMMQGVYKKKYPKGRVDPGVQQQWEPEDYKKACGGPCEEDR